MKNRLDEEMILLKNEILALKGYVSKQASQFRTEEFPVDFELQWVDNGSFVSATLTLYLVPKNDNVMLCSAALSESEIDTTTSVQVGYMSHGKNEHFATVFCSSNDQSILTRVKNGEIIKFTKTVYITSTSSFTVEDSL